MKTLEDQKREYIKAKGLTEEQFDKFHAFLTEMAFSFEKFSNYAFKDDEASGFTVPTRMNRIETTVPQFQSEIMARLQGLLKSKRLCLASPRGYTKSTTCSIFFPIWASLFYYFKEILIVSNSEALSINFLRAIKTNLESNERITGIFESQQSSKWTETHIITNMGTSIRACGWGAQIRGFRPDLIILDDIESDETVASEDIRKKMKEWVLKAAINSLTPNGAMLWVGTLITRLALIYDWIHHPPEGWEVAFYKAYKDGIMEPGHELWPESRPHSWLKRRRQEIGSVAFSSEYLNEPVPSEGNRFNPNFFKFYSDEDLKGKDVGMYISVDPAFSEESSSDYGVVMVCWHDRNDNIYVKEYYHEHTTGAKLIRELKRLWGLYRNDIRGIGIEEVGPQKAFYQQVVQEFMRDGQYPPFKKLTGMLKTSQGTHRNKIDRITYALQPRIEQGKVYFKRDQYALLDELTLFPESKHDDAVDALSYITALVEQLQDYSEPLDYGSDGPDIIPLDRGLTGYGDSYEAEEAKTLVG